MRIVRYTRDAERVLRRMPVNTAALIRSKVSQYASNPSSLARDVAKLLGREGYRPRVGNWRVIFDDDGTILMILAVGPRGGIYD